MKRLLALTRALSSARDAFRLLAYRKERIDHAPGTPAAFDPLQQLARRLHPPVLGLRIDRITEETPSVRTFRLVPDTRSGTLELAPFRAGQYLSLRLPVETGWISRPYSISSTPREALEQGFYEVTIQRRDGGFFTRHVFDTWQTDTCIKATGPHGLFYHDPLRDAPNLVALAGGVGITPFRSIVPDLLENALDTSVILIHGVDRVEDAVFRTTFEALEGQYGERFRYHLVCREPTSDPNVHAGLLSRDLIERLTGAVTDRSFFVCGPPGLYRYLEEQMADWNLPRRRVRIESFGAVEDVTALAGYPVEKAGETFTMRVHVADATEEVPAAADETLLSALERAGLTPPSGCRSGTCGACDALLLAGEVFIPPGQDGRRMAFRETGHVHPCMSYPLSDLELRIYRRA